MAMVPPSGGARAAGNNPPRQAAGRSSNGYAARESRVLIALLLASALLFFLTYQLFGAAAATGVALVFLAFALAAHRVRFSRTFPFLHLSTRTLPAAAAGRRGWFRRPAAAAAGTAEAEAEAEEAGMDAAAIAALPAAFEYKREHRRRAASATGWAQCAICLGFVGIGEPVRRLPTCGHLFHAGCIDKWLRAHATCPLCRAAVVVAVPELLPVI